MCELLVWAVDQVQSGDPSLDCNRPLAGCVIVSCPDGWGWTQTEQTDPRWRILKFPGVDPSVGRAFLANDPNYQNPQFPFARRWIFAVDHTKLILVGPTALTYWSDTTRIAPSISSSMNATQLLSAQVTLPALQAGTVTLSTGS